MLTNNVSRCELYQSESENVKERWACVMPENYLKSKKWRNYVIPNNEEDCKVLLIPGNKCLLLQSDLVNHGVQGRPYMFSDFET